MENLKVVKIDSEAIEFENGIKLCSNHESDCCERHYLSFDDLELSDFDGLEFDLSGDTFFKRIKDYGIELVSNKGFTVKVPGYGYNNGYYSDNLTLCLSGGGFKIEYDITECQVINK
jgi:hypothetical protein